jgi:hypothetical protein
MKRLKTCLPQPMQWVLVQPKNQLNCKFHKCLLNLKVIMLPDMLLPTPIQWSSNQLGLWRLQELRSYKVCLSHSEGNTSWQSTM